MRSKKQHSRRRRQGVSKRVACRAEPKHLPAASGPQSPPSRLQVYVAGQILALIRQDSMRAGQPLREEALAQRLDVSRTSVRGALRILGNENVVDARRHRGYLLRRNASELEQSIELPPTLDEQLYLRIAHDYLSGALPESTTETDFMRRYDASRHLVLATLTLLSEEGIIHRGKGREWRFRDVLKSSRGREESYELRLMIEPGAVLLPTFQIARSELEEMRTLQQKLLNVTAEPSHREVFHTDASFHELIARFSGNGLELAAIRQQNRVRRLLEYQSNLDADRVRTWSLEHIGVIDALLEGDQHLAARCLTKHLENARLMAATEKPRDQRRRPQAGRNLLVRSEL
jgi:DNA-binding GntR family transcriptional regulator